MLFQTKSREPFSCRCLLVEVSVQRVQSQTLIGPTSGKILAHMNQNPTCANSDGLQWSIRSEGQFQVCGETTPRLPAGGYSCEQDQCGQPLFVKRQLESDNLINVAGSLAADILQEVTRFWTLSDRFHQFGFLHRRGYLFYGKQGGGKSSLIHQIVMDVVNGGNVAFFCGHPYSFTQCLVQFRKIEPDRPLVCIFEDIEAIIEDYGDNLLLQWLDGNYQVDRAINLASTNYPEQLDRRIIARPRRFDRILRIDSPCEQLRGAYLQRKLPEQSAQERQQWVTATEGFTFAALAELIVSVCCLENDFDESVLRLRQLDRHEPSSLEFADAAVDAATYPE